MKSVAGRCAVLVLFLAGMSGCGYGNWHGGYGGHMIGFGYGGKLMWLLFFIVIGATIYLLWRASKGAGRSVAETPLDILKNRYARGDISKEEFEKMKADIDA